MKHLNDFESIDEKLKWKHLLLALGISISANYYVKDFKSYNKLKHIYSLINSPKSNPTKEESKHLEEVRQRMIQNVKKSKMFDKFNKPWLLDSLKNIHFKVIDSINFSSSEDKNLTTEGCYFYLKPLKGVISKLAGEPSEDNMLILRRGILKNEMLDEIIIHELYHYVDRLTKYNYDISDSFLDKKSFVDTTYGLNKMINIITANNYNWDNFPKPDLKKDLLSMYNDYKRNKMYYTSSGEIFARWHAFKSDLLKAGYIDSIDDMPTKKDIYKFMWLEKRLDVQYITLLLALDWDKFNEIDK